MQAILPAADNCVRLTLRRNVWPVCTGETWRWFRQGCNEESSLSTENGGILTENRIIGITSGETVSRHWMKRCSPVIAFALTLLMSVTVLARQDSGDGKNGGVPTFKVKIIADGETQEMITSAKSVQALLKERKIALGDMDRTSIALAAPLSENLTITVTRIRTETATERQPVPFTTERVYEVDSRAGSRQVRTAGKPGERKISYRDYYRDNVRTARVKMDETVTPPQKQIEIVGLRGSRLSSRGSFSGRRVITMLATGYGPGGNGKWGMRTATGMRHRFGIVAVDPRIIPLGTRVFVEGYGSAIAGDVGSAIKGKRIDLAFDTDDEAEKVGRRTVQVLILD